jgi:hypothetical protein
MHAKDGTIARDPFAIPGAPCAEGKRRVVRFADGDAIV